MERQKQVLAAVMQGAAYGFEKGFESALDHLRAALDHMPGENSRALVAKLVESIEMCSEEAHTGFMDDIEICVIVPDETDVEVNTPQ